MGAINARETAYRLLRHRILNLDLKPLDVLNDRELEAEIGVSRTPIREAIIMLSLSHMVVVRPQSSTYVAPIDLGMVRVEQFSRYVLEKEMAVRACSAIRDEHWREYEEKMQLYELYKRSHVQDREDRMLELDNAFHRTAFAINGEEACFDWILSSFQHIERIRILSLRMGLDEEVVPDHQEIAEAIRAGDTDRTVQAMRQHLTRYDQHVPIMQKEYPHFFQGG